MRKFALFSAALFAIGMVASGAMSQADAASPTLDKIKESKSIAFGYRNGADPFSYKDREGRIRGYSVELCMRIAAVIQKQLAIPELKIEWTPTEAATRLESVANGKVDIDCGTTTIALSRMEKVDFSLPIYVDGGGILVRTRKKQTRMVDLKNKRIAVITGTTTEKAVTAALNAVGALAEIVPVANGHEGMAMLDRGQVDGYAGDRVVLANLKLHAPDPNALTFVVGDFSYEPYGLVVRRDDPDFRLAVNRALVGLYRTGDIDAIFQRWLGALGRPGTLLHAMFYLNTLPE